MRLYHSWYTTNGLRVYINMAYSGNSNALSDTWKDLILYNCSVKDYIKVLIFVSCVFSSKQDYAYVRSISFRGTLFSIGINLKFGKYLSFQQYHFMKNGYYRNKILFYNFSWDHCMVPCASYVNLIFRRLILKTVHVSNNLKWAKVQQYTAKAVVLQNGTIHV